MLYSALYSVQHMLQCSQGLLLLLYRVFLGLKRAFAKHAICFASLITLYNKALFRISLDKIPRHELVAQRRGTEYTAF